MSEEICFDQYDSAVIDTLEEDTRYRGHEIRDLYREKTRIRSKVKAKDRAKNLTKSGLFTKVGWGTWEYQGDGQ